MKLLIVVPDAMFDASLPLIKALKSKIDIYCLFEVHSYSNNLLQITTEEAPTCNIIEATQISKLAIYKDFIPLNKSKIISVSSPKSLSLVIKSQIKIATFVKSLNPDYIYYYNTPSINFIPLIYTTNYRWGAAIHDPILHSSQKSKTFYSFIRKIVFRRCNTFFLFSDVLVDDFRKEYKIKDSQVHLTSLGAYEQLNLFSTNTPKTNPSKRLNLLFFGRIEKYKGIKFLLEAYKKIYQNYDIALRILGKGFIENDIVDLTQTPGLFVKNKFIPVEELATEIQNCDIVICPYTDATQSGVVMSAYAFCKPVIVTNVGGLSEMVRNKKTGLIIEPCSSKAIVNSILFVYNNMEIIQEWKQEIVQLYYNGEHSWNHIANNLINIINNDTDKKRT